MKKKKINYEFKNDQPMLISIYVILFTIGIMLLSIAISYYNSTVLLLRDGVNTTATVSELLEVSDGDGGTSYKPVFKFKDFDGRDISFQNPVSSNPSVWKRGESVSIIYDPASPANAKVLSYWGLFRWTVICSMIAAPLLVVSIGYFAFLAFIN